jgi:hypothetical protein
MFSKFSKYCVLLLAMILTLFVVFDSYSFYLARRDIDAELKLKKVPSLEYLNLLLQRERALVVSTLEGRCTERLQLTMFRLFNAQHDKVHRAYNELFAIKAELSRTIEKFGAGIVDVEKARAFIDGIRFDLVGLDRYLVPLDEANKTSAAYQKLQEEVTKQRSRYAAVAAAHAPLREEIEKLISEGRLEDSKYWNMEAIRHLASRIDQLRDERKKNREKHDVEDIIARYAVWIGALTGGVADHSLSDDIAYQMGKADAISLAQADCKRFEEYYQLVTGRAPVAFGSWVAHTYRRNLSSFFQLPPGAQTLFVTLILGALGALTLNVLRMSSVGWWAHQPEPVWGEIIVAPFLGALAAFGIFLIGNAGLLLTTDSNGGQPLSAYFIGLLGFLSGLMYDEAFGRVRRIGTQWFATTAADEVANARAEDRALAEVLRNNGASLAANLLLKYGVGTRIEGELEFTLLVPSDDAIGRLPLATWNSLNDSKGDAFEKWYRKHHAVTRVSKADVKGEGQAAPVTTLLADDSTSHTLALDGDVLTINGIRVLISDISWKKGIIHILSEDFT